MVSTSSVKASSSTKQTVIEKEHDTMYKRGQRQSRSYFLNLALDEAQDFSLLKKTKLARIIHIGSAGSRAAPSKQMSSSVCRKPSEEKLGGAVSLHETDGKKFIRGKSCPLAAITAHYPDACLIVEALLTEIIGAPVKEYCAHGESPSCCFEVS